MALLNEILVGRYNRLVQKLLSMKGPAALVQIRGEMGVEIPLFHGAENRYLEAWDLFGLFITPAAAGAGNVSRFCVRNPAGSNVIAVVTRAGVIDPTAGTPAAAPTLALNRNATTDQNTVTAAQGWDLRGRPSSTLIASNNSGAPAATGGTQALIATGSAGANIYQDLIPPGGEIPVTPGVALQLFLAAANTAGAFMYWWRERFLEDSERT